MGCKMSKSFVNSELLKSEIRALNYYVSRSGEFNIDVAITMIDAIKEIAEGLKPCELKEDKSVTCPNCYSHNVEMMFGTTTFDGHTMHYICEDCHKEFDV